jgi:hypothetical protein
MDLHAMTLQQEPKDLLEAAWKSAALHMAAAIKSNRAM